MPPQKMTAELKQIKSDVDALCNHELTTIPLNLYKTGADSNGWHAGNEKELGENPVIASVSFGATRPFHFKHRTITKEKYKINLEHGSLLIMKGAMQHF